MMLSLTIKLLPLKLAIGLLLEFSDTTALTARLLADSASPRLSLAMVNAYMETVEVYGTLIPQLPLPRLVAGRHPVDQSKFKLRQAKQCSTSCAPCFADEAPPRTLPAPHRRVRQPAGPAAPPLRREQGPGLPHRPAACRQYPALPRKLHTPPLPAAGADRRTRRPPHRGQAAVPETPTITIPCPTHQAAAVSFARPY